MPRRPAPPVPDPETGSDGGPPHGAGPRRALPRLAEGVAAFVAFTVVTLALLGPGVGLWRDHLPVDLGDPFFNTYVLSWSSHQLQLGLPAPWDANVFHPLPASLTLSDHLYGPAALALPVTVAAGNAVAGYNLLFLLAFALTGTTTYLVLRASGLGRLGATVGAAAFAFAPYRWEQAAHLQVVFSPWIPPVLWLFDRLLVRPGPSRAAAFAALYLLHVTAGNYLAYMVHVPLLVLLVNRAVDPEVRRRWRRQSGWASLGAAAAFSVAVLLSVFLPYLETARRLGLERGPDAFRVFGAHLVALLIPARTTPWFDAAAPLLRTLTPGYEGGYWHAEKTLFPGFVTAALAAVALVAGWRRYRRRGTPLPPARRRLLALLAGVALAAFLAADLYTLAFTGMPGRLQRHVGWTYALLGLAVVVAAGAWWALRRRWGRGGGTGLPFDLPAMPAWNRGVLGFTLATLLLSFPVFFTPAAEVLPGLAGMRVPSRFFVFTLFGLAVAAAHGSEIVAGRLRRRAGRGAALAAGLALLVLLVAESAPRGLTWHRVPLAAGLPSEHRWLAAHRGEVGAFAEVPFETGHEEKWYMYHSTFHWLPTVNGSSAHEPPFHRRLRESWQFPVPTEENLSDLRSVGVTHLVMHPVPRDARQQREYDRWLHRIDRGWVPGVETVHESATGTVVLDVSGWAAEAAR